MSFLGVIRSSLNVVSHSGGFDIKNIIRLQFLLFLALLTPVFALWIVTPSGDKILPLKKEIPAEPSSLTNTTALTTGTNRDSTHITGIKAELLGDVILLTWTNPIVDDNYQIRLYRGDFPLSTETLNPDKIVTELAHTTTSYTDKSLGQGDVFYALTLLKNGTNEGRELFAGENTTSEALTLSRISAQVFGLEMGVSPDKRQIQLNWKTDITNIKLKYQIFRSTSPYSNLEQLPQPVAIVTSQNYMEGPLPPADYFYAVTPQTGPADLSSIRLGINALSEPVSFQIIQPGTNEKEADVKASVNPAGKPKGTKTKVTKKTTAQFDLELKKILSSYYKKQYKQSSIQLAKFLTDPSCPTDVRNRAKLFLAKSYYHTGRYRDAVKILIELRSVYPQEAKFWYDLAMKHI